MFPSSNGTTPARRLPWNSNTGVPSGRNAATGSAIFVSSAFGWSGPEPMPPFTRWVSHVRPPSKETCTLSQIRFVISRAPSASTG
ncbi:MAG: hypothetical protein ACT4PT_05500 [Methanobacteriota archaeon]